MKSIGAAKFKEKCLAIIDHVKPEGLIITKHGKPLAKLTPISSAHGSYIGAFKGKIKVRGTILGTGRKWHAQS